MFLQTVTQTNKPLVDAAFSLHQEGILLPDTYLVDVDMVVSNAVKIKRAADTAGLELYFMSKQMGRNPYLCRLLTGLGYPGAVVVDYREAMVMMENHIPIAHAGHLVQIPTAFLPRLIRYGVGLITVYSVEKAAEIDGICQAVGMVQNICLRVTEPDNIIYPGQEGGFRPSELPELLDRLKRLKNIRVAALTAFPCYLYDREERKILPCKNLDTVLKAQAIAEEVLGRKLHLNLPSCTQSGLIPEIAAAGGASAEPGSALIGTVPNNEEGAAAETLAIVYVSEISHAVGDKSFCYGGGLYPRGQIHGALVGGTGKERQMQPADPLPAGNIDYYLTLRGRAAVGAGVVMCFRPQIFTSRSRVALLEGLSTGDPHLVAVYDAQGGPCP